MIPLLLGAVDDKDLVSKIVDWHRCQKYGLSVVPVNPKSFRKLDYISAQGLNLGVHRLPVRVPLTS